MKRYLLRTLYNTAGLAFLSAAALPVLLTPKWRRGLGERLGLPGGAPPDRGGSRCIWIHGASVGEVLAARGLVQGLRTRHPSVPLMFTTFTEAGKETVRSRYGNLAREGLLPLDWNGIPSRALERVRPLLFILLETELWPNLLDALCRKGCPAVLVNGRLSERSFPRYRSLAWFFRPFLGAFSLVCARTEVDGERFRTLGVSPERIRVTGNIKYDQRPGGGPPARAERWRKRPGGGAGKVVVAGSLRGGENEMMVRTFLRLREESPGLRLVIAPRHPERFDPALLDRAGLSWVPWSAVGRDGIPREAAVVFVDTVGDLPALYGLADVAFVGGTFEGGRGHNLLEPASQGVPVLFGPGYLNFLDEGKALLEEGGGVSVGSPEALAETAAAFLRDGRKSEEAGMRARAVAGRFSGALARTLDSIGEVLGGEGE